MGELSEVEKRQAAARLCLEGEKLTSLYVYKPQISKEAELEALLRDKVQVRKAIERDFDDRDV